jgi:hypothetical protein
VERIWKHARTEFVPLLIIVPVKLAGRERYVMFALGCRDVSMVIVLRHWNVIAMKDGPEAIVICLLVPIVSMDIVMLLMNARK